MQYIVSSHDHYRYPGRFIVSRSLSATLTQHYTDIGPMSGFPRYSGTSVEEQQLSVETMGLTNMTMLFVSTMVGIMTQSNCRD